MFFISPDATILHKRQMQALIPEIDNEYDLFSLIITPRKPILHSGGRILSDNREDRQPAQSSSINKPHPGRHIPISRRSQHCVHKASLRPLGQFPNVAEDEALELLEGEGLGVVVA
jgi:hypothetical protein